MSTGAVYMDQNMFPSRLVAENTNREITIWNSLKTTSRASQGKLEIINSLFEKPQDLITKSGTGIKNIKERYRYFSEEDLIFEKNNQDYRVCLPLLEIETI